MRWRRLVEPGFDLSPVFLTSGSYDTFAQLVNPFRVFLGVDEVGSAVVAVPTMWTAELFEAHNAVFGESLHAVGDPSGASDPTAKDVIVTGVGVAGERLYSVVVGTSKPDEPYGVRVHGRTAFVVGRTELVDTARGFAGFLASLSTDTGAPGPVATPDLDPSQVFFDLAVAPDGRLYVVGGGDYEDNPGGASISERCVPLGALVSADLSAATRFALPDGPRHSHARTAVVVGDRLLVAGQHDGPGTHTGDADRSLIRAEPFGVILELPR